jgi:hypothetical protein
MQERLLSRRIIHCTENQLHWECRCLEASEAFPGGLAPKFNIENKLVSLDRLTSGGRLNGFAQWWIIRKRFICADITRDTDRLPALAGIARRLHEIMRLEEEDYLAGLERSRLALEMGWTIDSRDRPRPADYCAPTWSWASTRGRSVTKYDLQLLYNCVKIMEAKSFPIKDPYGQVNGGYVRLSGMLCEVTLLEMDEEGRIPVHELDPPVKGAQFDGYQFAIHQDPDPKDFMSVWLDWNRDCSHVYWDGYTRDTLTRFSGLSFHFLLLHFHTFARHTDSTAYVAHGLLLKQTRQKKGEYQQVGMLVVEAENLRDALEDVCTTRPLPEDAYQEKMKVEGERLCTLRDSDSQANVEHIQPAADNTICEVHLRNEHAGECGDFPGRDQYTIEII